MAPPYVFAEEYKNDTGKQTNKKLEDKLKHHSQQGTASFSSLATVYQTPTRLRRLDLAASCQAASYYSLSCCSLNGRQHEDSIIIQYRTYRIYRTGVCLFYITLAPLLAALILFRIAPIGVIALGGALKKLERRDSIRLPYPYRDYHIHRSYRTGVR